MKPFLFAALVLCLAVFPKVNTAQFAPNLGEAARYSLYSQIGAISNTGTSTITGDIGNNVGAVTGFGAPSVFSGSIQNANLSTWQAEYDISLALGQLTTQPFTGVLPNSIGGGDTLTPGVYQITGALGIAGNLYLDGGGDTSAVFIFQISGAFTSNASSGIILINGAQAGYVFWSVNGAATMGASSVFMGTIIAKGAISCSAACSFTGRALSTVGAVSLNNAIGILPNGPYITTVQTSCAVATGSITVNTPAGPGFTYAIGGAFQLSPVFNGLLPGKYFITVKDANGIIVSAGVSTVIHPQYQPANPYHLGEAGGFVLFTSSGALSNTSTSFVTGNIGTNLGAVSGMGSPTVVTGNTHNADALTAQAKLDLAAAYLQLKSAVTTSLFPAAPGNGEVYPPGVYNIAGACAFSGNLILDGGGNPNAMFVFKIGGAFTSGAGATIILTNGANANRVFWVVTGAAAFAAQTTLIGTVINDAAISFGDGSILHGRALSTVGAVSIYGTLVYSPFQCYSAVPLPNFLTLRLKVLLQGAVIGNVAGFQSTMRDNLRNSPFTATNLLPLSDPYTDNPSYSTHFTKVGDGLNPNYKTILQPATMFADAGTASVVDWIFIELRSKADSTVVLSTRSVMVKRDGTVVDIDGSLDIKFESLLVDDYYVAVRHRNHLGTMTAAAIPAAIFNTANVIDFSTMTSAQLWNYPGYNGFEQAILADGKLALWAGNANADRKIKYSAPNDDLFQVFVDALLVPANTSFDYNFDFGYGYIAGDLDMNSKIKYTAPNDDAFILFVQLLIFGLNTNFDYNFDFFAQQIPY